MGQILNSDHARSYFAPDKSVTEFGCLYFCLKIKIKIKIKTQCRTATARGKAEQADYAAVCANEDSSEVIFIETTFIINIYPF